MTVRRKLPRSKALRNIPPNKVRQDKRKKPPKYPPITHSMSSDDCPYPELW